MNDNHTAAVITESLTRVLDNARFSSSPQMSAFLRYVVDEAVAGNADRIKAYSVAVDALGKPESFDAQKDPCVRVLAMRLRESLADYYQENDEPVVITIPRGSYKPRFTFSADNATSASNARIDEDNVSGDPNNGSTVSPASTIVAMQTHEATPESNSTERDRLESVESRTPAGSDPAPVTGFALLTHRQTLRWVLASVTLALGLWLVFSNRHQPTAEEMNSTSIDTVLENPQLAAAKKAAAGTIDMALRPRPTLPTVHIWADTASDELVRQIGIAVSGVLSKFKNLVVIRDHAGISQVDAWPEDYALRASAMTVNKVIRVNAELTHVATGAIAYSASFEFARQDGDVFTPRVIDMIEAFSAQLARYDGPLVSDYRQRDGIRPELACLYDLQSQQDWNDESGGHTDHIHDYEVVAPAEDADRCGIIPSLLDNTQLSSIMLSVNLELDAAGRSTTSQKRQVLLDSATTLAEQAVSLGPYRADTHAILMKTLRMTGKLDQALVHGARAMELNRFDSQFLREYAQLLSEVDQSERAHTVEAMADKLDPLG